MINKECMQVFWIHSLNYVSWGLSCGAETLEHNISIIAMSQQQVSPTGINLVKHVSVSAIVKLMWIICTVRYNKTQQTAQKNGAARVQLQYQQYIKNEMKEKGRHICSTFSSFNVTSRTGQEHFDLTMTQLNKQKTSPRFIIFQWKLSKVFIYLGVITTSPFWGIVTHNLRLPVFFL